MSRCPGALVLVSVAALASCALPPEPLTAPTNVDVSDVGTTSARLRWSPVALAERYAVAVVLEDGTKLNEWFSPSSELLVPELPSGTALLLAVRALRENESSSPTAVRCTTLPKAPPALTADTSSGSVQLQWTVQTGARGYRIYRREAGGSFQAVAESSSSAWSTPCTNGAISDYRVASLPALDDGQGVILRVECGHPQSACVADYQQDRIGVSPLTLSASEVAWNRVEDSSHLHQPAAARSTWSGTDLVLEDRLSAHKLGEPSARSFVILDIGSSAGTPRAERTITPPSNPPILDWEMTSLPAPTVLFRLDGQIQFSSIPLQPAVDTYSATNLSNHYFGTLLRQTPLGLYELGQVVAPVPLDGTFPAPRLTLRLGDIFVAAGQSLLPAASLAAVTTTGGTVFFYPLQSDGAIGAQLAPTFQPEPFRELHSDTASRSWRIVRATGTSELTCDSGAQGCSERPGLSGDATRLSSAEWSVFVQATHELWFGSSTALFAHHADSVGNVPPARALDAVTWGPQSIAADPLHHRIFVAGTGGIATYRLESGSPQRSAGLLLSGPRALSYDDRTQQLLALSADGALVVLDASSDSLVPSRTVSLALEHRARDFRVSGDSLLVADGTKLKWFDASGNASSRSYDAGDDITSIAVEPIGQRIAVVIAEGARVVILSPTANVLATLTPRSYLSAVSWRNQRTLLVTSPSGTLTSLDADSGEPVGTVALGPAPGAVFDAVACE